MHSSRIPKTIPDVVAHNSETNPAGPFYIYSDLTSSEIVTITHLEFGRAVGRAAHILRPHHSGSDGEVVAILALSDTILYHAMLVALITANLVPFPISPRNSPAAVVHLLRTTSCRRVISTCVTLAPLIAGIKQEFAQLEPDFVLKIDEAPALSQIYPNLGAETLDCSFDPYAPPTNVPSLDDVCFYLHSSGSTGLPKAIPQTHRSFIQQSSFPAATETRDHKFCPIGVMGLPSFHTLGLYLQLVQPLNGNHVAVYPPTAISPTALPILPSPNNILEHTRKTNCTSLMTIPALFSVWATSPEAIAYLKTLRVVLWAGGAVPHQLGTFLHGSGIKLRGMYGATETGPICFPTSLKGDEDEWEWYRFANQTKVRWVPQGEGTFECQLLTWEKHTLMVENLPDVKGYATSDLWINHPEKKHLWKIVGRIDDVIIHSSGENTVPAPMEDIILASPYVAGAVMFGRDRDQAGILIEPTPALAIDVEDPRQCAGLRNKIWPVIEEANKIAPAFSRIFKEMIIFTSQGKPLPRAAKGTVQRKPAVDLYAREIDDVYGAVAENTDVEPPTVWRATHIEIWLSQVAKDLCDGVEIAPEMDLFQQGFDSLSATVFRIRIMGALRSSTEPNVHKASEGVNQNLVYSQPTISKLSAYLEDLVNGTAKEAESPDVLMHGMIAKYTSGFAQPVASAPSTANPMVILLTGSTGNLGSQLLASLLQNHKVAKVYAFNRPSSASAGLAQRHATMFEDRGLDIVLLASPKLAFVEGHLNHQDLGLSSHLYNEIRASVTLIIHNAWQLDFNLPLQSFEPYIQGMRHLADLALSSPVRPKFAFTSSIAAMASDPTLRPSPREAMSLGYGQSKFVAEQILNKSGLRTASLRIGQIFGGLPKGAWSTSDWIPILVKTSMTLGHLPLTDGLVSWLDFETSAQAVLDVAFDPSDSDQRSSVFTVVNPRPVSWNSVMTFIREAILKECSTELQFLSFAEWYASLESLAVSNSYSKADETSPGIKLLEFFGHLANMSRGSAGPQVDASAPASEFSTDKIQALSEAMRNAKSITSENAEAWVKYWKSSGFL
ncbi:putative aminoadipate reductase [Mycena vulgaris]|nr:putative aminoadipate reductase [Mycena vulgaris]